MTPFDTGAVVFPNIRLAFYRPGRPRQRVGHTAFLGMMGRGREAIEALSDPGDRVGLIYRSGPALVALWFSAMATGRIPLILQYPTEKQAAGYWGASVSATLTTCGLRLLVVDPAVAGALRAQVAEGDWSLCPLAESAVEGSGPSLLQAIRGWITRSAPLELPGGARFLQQSSGTTGFRKGVEYALADVETHVSDFGGVIGMTKADRVVSWLPLYHDMGFVACFLMPLLLGARLALIDPMDWVSRKVLLLEAIRAEKGTLCYMPNFGFEVMGKIASRIVPGTVRLWVSCSEPSREVTLNRFAKRFAVPSDRMASCYAMAENIFAVSFRRGIQTRIVDGANTVSCGAPIPGVEVRVDKGEILVRSAYAMDAYVGSASIRTSDGYYATGDLGDILDGELYVTGRKAELINQSGQKTFLSDIDRAVDEALPWARGRVAATAAHDPDAGTDLCRLFLESERFFDPDTRRTALDLLRAALPVTHVDLVLTPPGFIIKTSSGKVNRRATSQRWLDAQAVAARDFSVPRTLADRLPGADLDAPITQSVDSLGRLIIELALGGISLSDQDLNLSIRQLEAKHGALAAAQAGGQDHPPEFRVAMLSDSGLAILKLEEEDRADLERRLGRPVQIDYVCLPPARVIQHNLTVLDWFPRPLDAAVLEPLTRAMQLLRSASLIVTDDYTEMAHAGCAYPLLDRRHRRGPLADRLVYRHQRVAQNDHLLPIGDVLLGEEIPRAERGADLLNLATYLRTPILRVALSRHYRRFTSDWEHQTEFDTDQPSQSPEAIASRKRAFIAALEAALGAAKPRPPTGQPVGVRAPDQAHFCCFVSNPDFVTAVLNSYDRFLFWGPDVNFEPFRRAAQARGKTATRVAALTAEGRLPVANEDAYECVVQAGPWRQIDTRLPVIRLMHGEPPDVQNWVDLDDLKAAALMRDPGDPASGYALRAVYTIDPPLLNDIRARLTADATT